MLKTKFSCLLVAGAVGLLSMLFSPKAEAVVTLYPTPANEPAVSTARFNVKVNNTSTAVYDFFNTRQWCGDANVTCTTANDAYTGEPHFAYFTTDENVTITVTTTFDFTNYTIRPLSKNITASKSGRTLTFTMPASARQLAIEFNGDAKNPLLLFSNPPDPNAPTASSTDYTDYNKKLFYIAPGSKTIDYTGLASGQYTGWTIYIAGGAVAKGNINLQSNTFTVKGPGIWATLETSGNPGTPVRLFNDYFTMKDTIMVSRRPEWTVQVVGVNDAMFDNVKILSEIKDGWNVVNSQRATLKNSFVWAFDDAVAMKGQSYGNNENVDNVTVDNCVLANLGGGNGIEFGYEANTPNMTNITFKNIDLIHSLPNGNSPDSSWPEGAITMHLDGPPQVSNVLYEDIRIEDNQDDYLFDFSYKGYAAPKNIDGVTVRNVRVVSGLWKNSRIYGKSSTAMVKNVSFIDLRKPDGTVVTSASAGGFDINQYTSNITFSSSTATSTNLLSNPSFDSEAYDTQTPSGWNEWSSIGNLNTSFTETSGGGKTGARHGSHYSTSAYNIYTFQVKTGLANGTYVARAWVKYGGGGQVFLAKNFGGTQQQITIGSNGAYGSWTQIQLPDIQVTNGQCEIGFYSDVAANATLYFDDVEFFKK